MKNKTILKLLAAIALCELVGALGAIFTAPSIPIWYASLAKPLLSPPNWVFAPVWTVLYALMGVTLWLIVETPALAREKRVAQRLFVLQLVLNIAWSFIFFGLHAVGAAFIEIVFLLLAIIALALASYRISKAAALLLVPYMIWVLFAAYLNLSLWMLNS